MAASLPHSAEIIARYGIPQEYLNVRSLLLGGVLALFGICFLAIVIEEMFLGGRRRRQAEKAYRARLESAGKIND